MTDSFSRRTVTALLSAAPLLGVGLAARAQLSDTAGAHVPAQAVRDLAIEAYIFGYPLVTMEMTRRVMTNAAKIEGLRGPMGQFVSAREYPSAAFKDVTAPNADTLYSSAWLDVAKEPYILHVPDERGRYYLMPMLNGWTDVFADPGTRTTGTAAGDFAIVGPGWQGQLPPGVEELRSTTNMVWIIGRTYCTARRKTTPQCMRSRPSTSLSPSAPGASPTLRPPARSIPAST